MKKATIFISVLFIILSVVGCGGKSNPSTPDLNLQSGQSDAVKTDSSVLWGIWDVSFNNATGNFDIVPLRTATFTANVNKIIEG
ncbi:MAG: hypothetical protein ABIC40_04720, partial [bacterium]